MDGAATGRPPSQDMAAPFGLGVTGTAVIVFLALRQVAHRRAAGAEPP